MKTLGIHCGHNASAALSIDGKVVGAAQEERFSLRKNQQGFPAKAIQYLLDAHLDGDASQIDEVAYGTKVIDPASTALNRNAGFSVFDHIKENHEVWYPRFYENKDVAGEYWRKMY